MLEDNVGYCPQAGSTNPRVVLQVYSLESGLTVEVEPPQELARWVQCSHYKEPEVP